VSVVDSAPTHWCPSGDPDQPESVVLGVRSGASGEVVYLAEPVPAREVLGSIPEGIPATRVLRFASHCVSGCANRVGDACGLIERIQVARPADEADLSSVPRCHLRPHCTWWDQAGIGACRRCPAVTTLNSYEDRAMVLAADPATTLDQLESWVAAAG
jgi:hypothetical protein